MTFRSLALGLGLTMGLTACAKDPDGSEFRAALPVATEVQVKVPNGSQAFYTLGQTAEFYQLTRGVSLMLNGGTAWVLILVHTIAQYPVTTVEGDTLIWGPWSDALNPAEYRLTATQGDDDRWTWSLEGRRKADGAAAEFAAVTSGNAGDLHGTFTLDFDRAEYLDPQANDGAGSMDVAYDITAREVVIDYARPETPPGLPEQVTTFHYEYREATDGSGDFVFNLHDDLDDEGALWETAEVRSRWLATGAGRSDFRVQDGDLGEVTVTGSECWDTSFGRVYFSATAAWQASEGEVASCAFADAAL